MQGFSGLVGNVSVGLLGVARRGWGRNRCQCRVLLTFSKHSSTKHQSILTQPSGFAIYVSHLRGKVDTRFAQVFLGLHKIRSMPLVLSKPQVLLLGSNCRKPPITKTDLR